MKNQKNYIQLYFLLMALLLGSLLELAPLRAQTRDLAALRGQVRDPQGAAVKGAQVSLRNVSTGAERQTLTDERGEYSFVGLPLTGAYAITASAPQLKLAEQKGIELRAGVTATIDFTLNVSGTESQITVYGTAGEGVQTDSNQITDRLGRPKIENTPVLNNRLTSLTLLDSSVRPSLTTGDVFTNETLIVVNGGGRRQTTYSIDNTNSDDSWGRQTIFTSLPFASVQEFTILTNSSSAEYGRNAGSAVNIVTKSGSNQFHGDFLGMGRPAFSEASAPLATTKAENTLAQGSGSLSGPIVHDRTYFIVSAEHTDQSRDAVITSPQAPGIFTGNFVQTLFLARVDHQLTAGNRLTFRANFDRFYDTNPQDGVSGNNLPSTARTFTRNTYAAAVTDTASLGASTINEARFQWQLASPVTQFIPQDPGPQVALSGFYTFGDSRIANLINHQYQEADTLSTVRGRHVLKAGFDLIQSSSGGFGQEFGSGFLDGQWAINNPAGCNYSSIPVAQVVSDLNTNPAGSPAQAVCTGAPPALVSSYTQSFGNQNYNIKETLWGVFLQDNWSVRNDLTLNLGVRYEGQTFLGDNNNVAPRIGLAWRLPHTSSTVLRAGYGIYYSEIRTDLAAGYALGGPTGIFTFSATPGKCGFPTTFAPWASLSALLQSPGCTNGGPSPTVPIRDITVQLGNSTFLNQFLNVSALHFYPSGLVNPYTQQWNLGIEHEIANGWILSVDYIGSHALKLERPTDLNAPAPFIRTAQGQTRSVAAANATRPVQPTGTCTTASSNFNPASGNCFNNYRQVLAIVNLGTGYYNGLQFKLNKHLSDRLSMLLTYTYSHAIDTVEPDAANQNANDWNFLGVQEKATSILDQRHRAALSGWYDMPWGFTFASNTTLASGLPYNITTGTDNNGDGTNSDRPIVNGALIPRNFGRGTPTYDVSVSLQKTIRLSERWSLQLRSEAFNLLNHSNFYGRNGTYGNNATPAATLGAAVGGISNTGPGRQLQFMARFQF